MTNSGGGRVRERGASQPMLKLEKPWSKQGQGCLMSIVEETQSCSIDKGGRC